MRIVSSSFLKVASRAVLTRSTPKKHALALVGRLKAFEERLKGLGEKEEEQDQVLMTEHKYGESSGQERGHGRSYGRGEREFGGEKETLESWRVAIISEKVG
nr:zinc finger, CCHC-type [Tanacetum cinerariifolium]